MQVALTQGDLAQLCRSFNEILVYVRDDLFNELEYQAQSKKHPLNQVPKPEPVAFYRTVLKLSLSSAFIIVKDEVANNLGCSDLEATTEDQGYIFALKRLESITEAAIDKCLDDGEKQILERLYGNNHPQPELPQTMVVLVISDTYRQICAWSRFKVQRTAQELVVVERHKELVAVSLQAFEHQQGLILPSSSSTTASAPEAKEQSPKSPRGRNAKASAPEAKE